jgi:Cytochrome c3
MHISRSKEKPAVAGGDSLEDARIPKMNRRDNDGPRRGSLFGSRFGWLLASLLLFAFSSYAQATNTCLDCHSALDPPLQVNREKFSQDIHAQRGLTCASCHGGNPASDDPSVAMGKAAGFVGKPSRAEIPKFCARCHSDPAYMRQYNPSLRTDQYSEYLTSVHGRLLMQGDTKVAVCIDCHSVHDIRPASDTRSKVNPLNVAATCAACHASAEYMKSYKIPTDQYAAYKASVHYEAMTVRGDLSAPTCSTCHGNHGAVPPGVNSVAQICSNCHVFQAQLFDGSPHKAAFEAMGLPSCVTCHSNHRILHPTDAFVGTGSGAICVNCHSEGDPGYQAAEQIHAKLQQLSSAIVASDEVLDRAESSGMEVSEPRLEEADARDALTKARVAVHSFQVMKVDDTVDAGLKVATKTKAAGFAALAERNYRRKGLALSLLTIVFVLIALWLMIRNLEHGK